MSMFGSISHHLHLDAVKKPFEKAAHLGGEAVHGAGHFLSHHLGGDHKDGQLDAAGRYGSYAATSSRQA